MKKGTTIAIIIVITVIIFAGVAIPALNEKFNEDFSSQSTSVSTSENSESNKLDPFVETIINTASQKHIDLLARLVNDTLNDYFSEEVGEDGSLVMFEDNVFFVATDNEYFSSLTSAKPGEIYGRVEYSVKKAYSFENSKNLIAFADAVEKCRAYSLGDTSVSESEMKESFKIIARINNIDASLVLEIVAGATKYQKLRNRCFNKFRPTYEEMFRGTTEIDVSASGRIRIYNDDKQKAKNAIDLELLNLYKELLEDTLN